MSFPVALRDGGFEGVTIFPERADRPGEATKAP